ncbi:cell division protein FtsA C-terminal domain-containing protein, partial [Enterococcus faecalis]
QEVRFDTYAEQPQEEFVEFNERESGEKVTGKIKDFFSNIFD